MSKSGGVTKRGVTPVTTKMNVFSRSKKCNQGLATTPFSQKCASTVPSGHYRVLVTPRILRSCPWVVPLSTKLHFYGTFRSLAPLGYTLDFTVAITFHKNVLLRCLPVTSPSWLHFGFHGRVPGWSHCPQNCTATAPSGH